MNLLISFTDPVNGIYERPINLIQSTFPAGERYLRISEDDVEFFVGYKENYRGSTITVTPLDATSDTIIDLLLFSDAIKQLNINTVLILKMFYTPYSRQDRACKEGESSSYKQLMGLLKQHYKYINTLDVHNSSACIGQEFSNTMPNYVENFISVNTQDTIKYFMESHGLNKNNTGIVVVDDGALDRCKYACRLLKFDNENLVTFHKIRLKDGKILQRLTSGRTTMFSFNNFLIIDDICDGGATFVNAINYLPKNANKYLVVSHGIFSKGLVVLKDFNDIFVDNNPYNKARLELITQNEIQF